MVPFSISGNGLFCFLLITKGSSYISFIYHNADSANNRLIVTLINY